MSSSKKLFEGPKIALVYALLCTIWGSMILLLGGFSEDSVLSLLGFTMRAALLVFVLVFAISSIGYFFKTRFTRWALRNRRYLGISFAIAVVLHFLAIGLRAQLYPDPFLDGFDLARVINGGALLATVLLLAFTSSDYAVRKLGPRLWKFVHLTGVFYIFYRFWDAYWGFLQEGRPFSATAITLLSTSSGFRVLKYFFVLARKLRSYGPSKDATGKDSSLAAA
jgi:DMSO/TMAO reductase YedYZ heme-binding membrane subunit